MESTNWNDLRVLLLLKRSGSFLAAGKALGLSTSTVARRISALEARLGSRVVRRSAHGATLEPAAAPLVALAEQMEGTLSVLTRDLSRSRATFEGTVRISLGDGFVRFVSAVVADFRGEHPETQVELCVDARPADLARREADIGIRTFRSTSEPLVVHRVGELALGVFASAAYLARRGTPKRSTLREHDFVGYEGMLAGQPEMRWLRELGAARFPFVSSSTDAIVAGVLAGQGIAAIPLALGAEHPTLRRIRLGADPPSKPIYLAMHRDLRSVPRVRALAQRLTLAGREALNRSSTL